MPSSSSMAETAWIRKSRGVTQWARQSSEFASEVSDWILCLRIEAPHSPNPASKHVVEIPHVCTNVSCHSSSQQYLDKNSVEWSESQEEQAGKKQAWLHLSRASSTKQSST